MNNGYFDLHKYFAYFNEKIYTRNTNNGKIERYRF